MSVYRTIASATLLVSLPLLLVGQTPPAPEPKPVCYQTESGGKCGTDIVYSWVQCGTSQCNTNEVIYDLLMNVKTVSSGLGDFAPLPCHRHTIRRRCEGSSCVLDGDPSVTIVATGTVASGDACGQVESP